MNEIGILIKDLQSACRQSLFNGNFRDSASTGDPIHAAKRQRKDSTDQETESAKSWHEILNRATSDVLSLMTDDEFGQVSRLVSILLLGFLLPHSTGNDYFTLQNISTQRIAIPSKLQKQEQKAQPSERISEYIIYMSLEERLENSPHRYGNDFGEIDDAIVHESLDSVFLLFLESLKTFLSARPAHNIEVDLIHIIAMAIHPAPSDHSIRGTSMRLKEKNSEMYELTLRLMRSLVPHSFQINYQHRVRLVEIVNNCLILPECQSEHISFQGTSLFEGAVPHLRASLYAFGMASTSQFDNHLSQRAMVNISIVCGMVDVIKEEWSRLLHRLVDDRTNYTAIPNSKSNLCIIYKNFCPHQARGELLRDFLMRYCESRRFADDEFLQFALSSLTDAIEMQVDCWTNERGSTTESESCDNNNVGKPTTDLPSRVLASLLKVAKELFHFLLPIKRDQQEIQSSDDDDDDIEESEDGQYRDMLISCVIQLVHHWNPAVVKEACSMLVLAFSYAEEMWDDYVEAVFDSLVIAIDITMKSGDSCNPVESVEGLVSAFSHRSLTFAVNLFELLSKKESVERNPLVVYRLIAAIANARPAVTQKHIGVFIESIKRIQNPDVNKHIVASILSCRKTHFFANEKDALKELMPIIHTASLRNWDKYQVSRHAMLTGNFSVASKLYRDLMCSALSETNYIWLSALEKIALGEARLCTDAAKALPESTTDLRSAINSFRFLSVLKQPHESFSTSFQIRLIELRVSFLDLLISTRQFSMEMRLVGVGPKKFTRTYLHVNNIVKLFDRISVDYLKLYKQHGLFICQQSRSVLRTLQTLCSFVARAARRVFSDSIIDVGKDENFSCRGDASHPLILFIKQLESLVVSKTNEHVDPKIRAVVLLQVIDGLLKVPIPTPRCLVNLKAWPFVSLQLGFDPGVHDRALDEDIPLEIEPGTSIVIQARGMIPKSLLSSARTPFSVVLLWYTVVPTNLFQTINHDDIDKHQFRSLSPPLPNTASMSSSGRFFIKIKTQPIMKEGRYGFHFRVGCRDIRGGEWELPILKKAISFVKIVRSRNQ